ncbi:RteC domain-containing protein [uncultured Croceitalea sp.]|uniref:RteC domain-containing protein n=1 Tax=uncultured Croceitalea sp. TaxID=1798908 RepID=UPI0033068384
MELQLLSQELSDELARIESITTDVVKKSDLSIVLCRNLLIKLKRHISKIEFESSSKEIAFFKYTKQVPLRNLVYFFELKSFEIHYPNGDDSTKRKYIIRKLKKLNSFFSRNLDFIQYIDQGKTYLDTHYFTREYFNEFNITHARYYFRDPEFSSSHDLLLAKLDANRRLIAYLDVRLKNIGKLNGYKTIPTNQLKWTASKTDMTELAYALKSSRAVNHGQVSIREIIKTLELAFYFKSGDPYQNYGEIRIRKKSRTKFLDDLTISLLSNLDKGDQ